MNWIRRFRHWALALTVLVVSVSAVGKDPVSVALSEKQAFRVVTLVAGLENPWSMAFLPDGRMLVTERDGRMRLVSQDFKLDAQSVEGLPEVVARGQGGLFDVVLHPDYPSNGWIYWSYNAPGAGGWGTAMARGKLQGKRMTEV